MSDTPRTDALIFPNGALATNLLEHARGLEVELSIALENQLNAVMECQKAYRELADARELLMNERIPHFHHESYCRKCNAKHEITKSVISENQIKLE